MVSMYFKTDSTRQTEGIKPAYRICPDKAFQPAPFTIFQFYIEERNLKQ